MGSWGKLWTPSWESGGGWAQLWTFTHCTCTVGLIRTECPGQCHHGQDTASVSWMVLGPKSDDTLKGTSGEDIQGEPLWRGGQSDVVPLGAGVRAPCAGPRLWASRGGGRGTGCWLAPACSHPESPVGTVFPSCTRFQRPGVTVFPVPGSQVRWAQCVPLLPLAGPESAGREGGCWLRLGAAECPQVR